MAIPSPAEARGGQQQDQDRSDSFGECVFHGRSLSKKGSQVRPGPTPPTCTLAATARMNRRQGMAGLYRAVARLCPGVCGPNHAQPVGLGRFLDSRVFRPVRLGRAHWRGAW